MDNCGDKKRLGWGGSLTSTTSPASHGVPVQGHCTTRVNPKPQNLYQYKLQSIDLCDSESAHAVAAPTHHGDLRNQFAIINSACNY